MKILLTINDTTVSLLYRCVKKSQQSSYFYNFFFFGCKWNVTSTVNIYTDSDYKLYYGQILRLTSIYLSSIILK